MNQKWKNFLLTENASFKYCNQIDFPTVKDESHNRIFPIAHLVALAVSGKDAANFLQGQITCNINDVTETKSCIGAFCTAKGRVITTFLLVKDKQIFLLIMPQELLEPVKKKLQMYILRSDVKLTDSTDDTCLIGLRYAERKPLLPESLFTTNRLDDGSITVSLPCNRELFIAEPQHAIDLWLKCTDNLNFKPGNSNHWRYLDIVSGLPWLTDKTSEEFIPQMLNLDKLGGISFNKGCYTGQEIVARTHYLGKAKREMWLAECKTPVTPEPNTVIIDGSGETEEIVGNVLQAQKWLSICKMLIVIQASEIDRNNLTLKNHDRNKITLNSAIILANIL